MICGEVHDLSLLEVLGWKNFNGLTYQQSFRCFLELQDPVVEHWAMLNRKEIKQENGKI